MGKTPKQYKRRSGATTPERIDVDDELERQLARNTRDQSTEREKTRLDQRREERRTERTKERERERENKRNKSHHHRRRSRSRSHSRERRHHHRSGGGGGSSSSRYRSRSQERQRERNERNNKTEIETITKETGLKVPEFLAGSMASKRSYMETAAKRKMLWGKKETGELTEQQKVWANLSVGDEKKTNKFQKLMGASKFKDQVKDDKEAKQNADKLMNKQSEMFNAFDNQFHQSRIQTHQARGRGFGN